MTNDTFDNMSSLGSVGNFILSITKFPHDYFALIITSLLIVLRFTLGNITKDKELETRKNLTAITASLFITCAAYFFLIGSYIVFIISLASFVMETIQFIGLNLEVEPEVVEKEEMNKI